MKTQLLSGIICELSAVSGGYFLFLIISKLVWVVSCWFLNRRVQRYLSIAVWLLFFWFVIPPHSWQSNYNRDAHKLIGEALGLWSFRLYESRVIYKNFNMCDQDFRFLEIQKFQTSRFFFDHSRWRSAIADGAGALVMQQSGQDSASWKYFIYICCAPGEKSWLCRTHQAHGEDDTFLQHLSYSTTDIDALKRSRSHTFYF